MSGLGSSEMKSPSAEEEGRPRLDLPSLYEHPVAVTPACVPPVVSHDAAMHQLGAMFPQFDAGTLADQLERNGRELERTIAALLALAERAEQTDQQRMTEDERFAQQLQHELNAPATRRRSLAGVGSSSISDEELVRLQLQQFNHREAIYHANNTGEFGAKLHKKERSLPLPLEPARTSREAKIRAQLTPMERIARDMSSAASASANRPATQDEMDAAKRGPKGLKQLRERRAKEEAAAAVLAGQGWIKQASGAAAAGPSASAMYGANLLDDGQGNLYAYAGDAEGYVPISAAHAAAMFPGAAPSAAAAASPADPFSAEKPKKSHHHHHHSSSSAAAASAAAAASSADAAGSWSSVEKGDKRHKKEKKEKERHHHHKTDRSEETPEERAARKERKRLKKERGSRNASPAPGSASAASAARPAAAADLASPTALLDALPEYSRNASVSRSEIVSQTDVEPRMKK